ncbi:hypothetical protein BDZ91DRAFT_767385 [Kalaharituber pfeilii]|nr:hypothetical protein BDZ91DRAFT_767385 [Kalaharituber pfeilii]
MYRQIQVQPVSRVEKRHSSNLSPFSDGNQCFVRFANVSDFSGIVQPVIAFSYNLSLFLTKFNVITPVGKKALRSRCRDVGEMGPIGRAPQWQPKAAEDGMERSGRLNFSRKSLKQLRRVLHRGGKLDLDGAGNSRSVGNNLSVGISLHEFHNHTKTSQAWNEV